MLGCVHSEFEDTEDIHSAKRGVIFQSTIAFGYVSIQYFLYHHSKVGARSSSSSSSSTCTGRAACPRRRQQRRRLLDGIVLLVERDFNRGGAGVHEAEVCGGDGPSEEEEGFYFMIMVSLVPGL